IGRRKGAAGQHHASRDQQGDVRRIMARFGLSAAPPTVAVEIARHRVSAASILTRDSALAVAAHAVEALPPGAVTPSLNATNISGPRAVAEALRRVLDRIGARPKRIALAIPDSVAKVSLLRFEKVPDRAPFRIAAATLWPRCP